MWARVLSAIRAHQRIALTVLVALLAGGTLTFVIDADGPDGPTPPVTFTYKVNAAAGDGVPTRTLAVPEAAVARARDALEGDLRTAPEQTPDTQIDAAHETADEIRAREDPLPTAGASRGFAGCVTKFVVNQSGRGGVRPQVQVLHYTVSGNRPGWDDVNAVVALFNRSSFQASSNFVIDGEGHCAYIVPIENKAWTQAGGNPFAISYEVINTGSESVYLAPAGLAKLRSVMREVARRTGIPLRAGRISGCTPTVSGIVDHRQGGICWGGHGDIGPFQLAPIVAFVARAPVNYSPRERRILAGVAARGDRGGHSHAFWCQRAQAQRIAIRRAARTTSHGWDHRHRAERFQAISKPYAKACR